MIPIAEHIGPQSMTIGVSGPDGANRLLIYTGVVTFTFKGTGSTWRHYRIEFEVGPVFSAGQVRDRTAIASLNSIHNDETAKNAGWAVNWVTTSWNSSGGRVKVVAEISVRDIDGFVTRMGYQVSILAQL